MRNFYWSKFAVEHIFVTKGCWLGGEGKVFGYFESSKVELQLPPRSWTLFLSPRGWRGGWGKSERKEIATQWKEMMMIDDDWSWLMMMDDVWWCLMMLDDNCWWLMMIGDGDDDGWWWLMIKMMAMMTDDDDDDDDDDDWWWLMLNNEDWWWLMMMDDNNDGQCWHSYIPKNKVCNYAWSTVLESTNPRFKTLAWLDDVGITVYPPEV